MKLLDVKALGFGLTGIPGIAIVNPPVMLHYVIGNLIAFIASSSIFSYISQN